MILYCAGCSIKVGDIKKGSLLKNGMVCLCRECYAKRNRCDGPRVELFARRTRKGWDSIGNEIDGSDIRDTLKLIAQTVQNNVAKY